MSDSRNEKISLYYSEGSSDKEYHVALEAKQDGYIVNFRYGRRGQAMQTGTKTPAPIAYEKAKSAYDKLVKEKKAKGYSEAESGAAYQGTVKEASFSGELPQLLNHVKDDAELQNLLLDNSFGLQEKMDGERRLVRVSQAGVQGINRKGLFVALPTAVEEAIKAYPVMNALFDGEQIGEVFHAFDLLFLETKEEGAVALRGRPYAERAQKLTQLLSKYPHPSVRLVPLICGSKDKRAAFEKLEANKAEGVVFKNLTALYSQGRPASGGVARKHKFVAHATCRVLKVSETKKSISLELKDETGKWVNVGNAGYAAHPKAPSKGALVEVQYLYAYRAGSLYQPVLIRERNDVDEDAASTSQLKYKPESSEDEEGDA